MAELQRNSYLFGGKSVAFLKELGSGSRGMNLRSRHVGFLPIPRNIRLEIAFTHIQTVLCNKFHQMHLGYIPLVAPFLTKSWTILNNRNRVCRHYRNASWNCYGDHSLSERFLGWTQVSAPGMTPEQQQFEGWHGGQSSRGMGCDNKLQRQTSRDDDNGIFIGVHYPKRRHLSRYCLKCISSY